MNCSPSGSSVLGISQARILERAAVSSCRASSQPRTEPQSLALQADSLPSELAGKSTSEPSEDKGPGFSEINTATSALFCLM